MDIQRPNAARNRLIRRLVYTAVSVLIIVSVSLGVSRLKPAAPTVERATVWIDTVKRGATKGSRKSKVQILIAEPQALKALDSENIVVRSDAASIQYLGGAQWGDRLPKIVQARLVQAFENSGRFGGVGRPGEGLAIDYQVMTDIRAFEIQTAGSDVATVEISVKLLNDRTGDVGSSKVFSASVPVGAGSDAFVRGLDAAFDNVAVELVNWTAGKI